MTLRAPWTCRKRYYSLVSGLDSSAWLSFTQWLSSSSFFAWISCHHVPAISPARQQCGTRMGDSCCSWNLAILREVRNLFRGKPSPESRPRRAPARSVDARIDSQCSGSVASNCGLADWLPKDRQRRALSWSILGAWKCLGRVWIRSRERNQHARCIIGQTPVRSPGPASNRSDSG